MSHRFIDKLYLLSKNPTYRRIGLGMIFIMILMIDPLVDALIGVDSLFITPRHLILWGISGVIGSCFIVITAYLVRRLTNTEFEKEEMIQHFDFLSKHANDTVFLLDEKYKIVEANDRATSMYGYSREELTSLQPLVLRIPEERGSFAAQHAHLEFEKGAIFESRHVRKDGTTFPVEVNTRIYMRGGKKYLWSIVRDITERKNAEQAIEHQRDRLRKLAARTEKIREEERERLAREIHDGLGQELTAIKMNLAVLSARLKHDDAQTEKINYLRELVDASILSARRMSVSLRPELLEELGLGPAIEWQVREFEKQYGISCTHKVDREPVTVKNGVAITLLRILQEALTNVEKHAAASHVAVKFEIIGKDLMLTIFDDGTGIPADWEENAASFGIFGMAERAQDFGGTVVVERLKEKGTRVTAHIPGALI
jgi:two-component system, NarL family, sensor histidine kinase UhpB